MDTSTVLREQIEGAHSVIEDTMADVTEEQAHWPPPGKANPLGATYAHAVLSEDFMVNGLLKGAAPLVAGEWAGRAGLSEPPPMPDQGEDVFARWFRSVRVDLPALRQYAQAVYKNTSEYVGSLQAADLDRTMDLASMGLGTQTVAWVLGNIIVWHVDAHCGEISCLKGLQGAKGYPF